MDTTIRERIFALRDEQYAAFDRRLVPNIALERVLGVRVPAQRALAREIAGDEEAEAFLEALPHEYLEENHLHAFLLDHIRDRGEALARLEAFLPHVDNWATCDSLCPKALRREPEALGPRVWEWIDSGRLYTARFGIGWLMRFFLDERFRPEQMEHVAAIRSEEYYLRMMVAWYMATACAKQYESAIAVLRDGKLDPWTHNKAIQKAVESFRVTDEHKAELRTLRRRGA